MLTRLHCLALVVLSRAVLHGTCQVAWQHVQPMACACKVTTYLTADVRGILDLVANYTFYSCLDIKAGFHAIPVDKHSQPLLAFCM